MTIDWMINFFIGLPDHKLLCNFVEQIFQLTVIIPPPLTGYQPSSFMFQ